MQYTIKDGIPTFSSDAADPSNPTQAERDAVLTFVAAEQAATTTAEAARLAKRPKRTEINALKSKAASDNSQAATKATVTLLIDMMDNIIAFQNVDVEEDA